MCRILFALLLLFLCASSAHARGGGYDLVYLWDSDLENVLDYQQELEDLLGEEASNHLRLVGRAGNQIGLIYDLDGSAIVSARLAVKQNQILRKAGFSECYVAKDQGYYRLYNVSYGHGPNLSALKTLYEEIYQRLGKEVGKDLCIERTTSRGYTLIYRRHGSRKSSYEVSQQHARLLRDKKIKPVIILENNRPIVFGESSHLDDKAEPEVAKKTRGSEAIDPPLSARKFTSSVQTSIARKPKSVERRQRVTRSSGRPGFEQKVEALIDGLRRKGALSRNESTGWMVYDLTRNETLVGINADKVFQAASMIKPFVALAYFHQVEKGKLTYGSTSRRKMEAMIQHSNNAATNWIMKKVGGPARCNAILHSYYSHIFKNTRVVEYIPPGGRTYRNSALPSDYIRFLQALWDNQLPHGKEMKRLMSLPGRDRLYDGTPIPQGTLVYNKTGSTACLCGDMGILVPRDSKGRKYPYALVGIIESSSRVSNYMQWMRTRGNVIRKVSTLVYKEMKDQYRLR